MLFGQLTDIAGKSVLLVDEVPDTDELVKALCHLFPALSSMKFRLAVDKKIITANTALSAHSQVAMLPPFSGG